MSSEVIKFPIKEKREGLLTMPSIRAWDALIAVQSYCCSYGDFVRYKKVS